ncbi:RNA polymerase sigma-70 factor [Lipingzhangella sp. LS1_29]|uniref:RNA polymerase sigma-70 factor n=1 Tax=Lipingzhangella rawalii TaxID=2055835 RepID=A0ABU2HAC6_9ACTN|nr:RNA polymerase sigma-70 factor [Lipingzhangella rawalii]MDS1271790.1 RNA polymerase sigma-70 factor [Lipingzhangella rawalii]
MAPPSPEAESAAAEFERQRPRLFALAYRMLGSAAEAEDAVQDTYLRWAAADRDGIEVPEAWLATVLTRQCLNRLGSARARREAYVGPWLPEPVLTPDPALGPLETVEQRESVSMALLMLLEQLTPPERAAFVLREAFAYSHRAVAETIGVSEANAQQLYRRARQRVTENGPRRFSAAEPEHQRIVERFFAAASGEDPSQLEALLAAEVTSWADGGGRVAAARRPVVGASKVARLLRGLVDRLPPQVAAHIGHGTLEAHATEANARPALLITLDGSVIAVSTLEVHDGIVTTMHTTANPEKLAFVDRQWKQVAAPMPLWRVEA